MIQLTQRGLVASSEEIATLSDTFARVHCVKLEQFLEPSILRWLVAAVGRATFVPRVHNEVDPPATDLWMSDPDLRGTLLVLFNDASLFEFIQQVSGCPPVGCFIGSLYRMVSELAHTDAWHDDIYDGRVAALSLNLSPAGYRGGLLQIRDKVSKRVIHEVANTGCGDAIVFRLSLDLEHVVTDVLPGPAKTAYAGWFKTHPSRATFLRAALTER